VTFDTFFDNLYADPRWPAFLKKIGKAPEQLARIEFRMPAGIVQ
jgi:hypothetical protein